ncbi:MAG: hypothetical protein A3K19_33450 [Lentisphaerae bacterium RIFOXYB12_FULL_65_16]|nr:MAG: hypothetical protein A3K18_05935 [Lentisphaerae bacterium RIFOXYA12_64_32]OGV86936.1 MAG: hypothetical protein A3K19_33450 [Lentisphaerae bacterium RIFOXYB12_FULL_65_16]
MAEKLGFGLLGSGLIAPFHAKSVQESDGGSLIAVCDTNRERADPLAGKFGVKAYCTLDDMLKDDRIHVVNVLLPNHLHHDAVVRSAKAGRHVIMEKPPAMTLQETDDMIAVCTAKKVKFTCMVQCRVRQAIQYMKKAVDDGRFGQILHADAYMKWFRSTDYYKSDAWRSSRKSGAGVTVQQAFHYIDLLQYIVGPVARVEAKMTNLAHPEIKIEDTVLSFVTYKNGALGVVQASTALWPGTDVRIEINGTNGTAIMMGEKMVTWKFRDERPEDATIRQVGSASQTTAAGGAADFGHLDHKVVIQNMIDAVRKDVPILIPVPSVRHTVEIVLGMYHSAARKTPIDLPVKDDPTVWDM